MLYSFSVCDCMCAHRVWEERQLLWIISTHGIPNLQSSRGLYMAGQHLGHSWRSKIQLSRPFETSGRVGCNADVTKTGWILQSFYIWSSQMFYNKRWMPSWTRCFMILLLWGQKVRWEKLTSSATGHLCHVFTACRHRFISFHSESGSKLLPVPRFTKTPFEGTFHPLFFGPQSVKDVLPAFPPDTSHPDLLLACCHLTWKFILFGLRFPTKIPGQCHCSTFCPRVRQTWNRLNRKSHPVNLGGTWKTKKNKSPTERIANVFRRCFCS